jgi:hypothetical protein
MCRCVPLWRNLLLLLLLCRLRERDEAKTAKLAAAGGWKESGKDKRRREAAAALEGASIMFVTFTTLWTCGMPIQCPPPSFGGQ